MVTHELQEAAALGKRIGVLSQGKLVQFGPQREIFSQPKSEEVAALVGMETRIPGVVQETAHGMTTVCFTGGTARVMGEFGLGERVTLCVRPEDISVTHYREQQYCPKETVYIRAKVRRIFRSMTQYKIALECGCGCVTALVTKSSFAELSLREGDDVLASFSFKAVHVI